jgi:hypothetical protein
VTTTTELLDALHKRDGAASCLDMVEEFCGQADAAKFAKWQPERDVCTRFLETAYRVVDVTTPHTTTAPQSPDPPDDDADTENRQESDATEPVVAEVVEKS